ncbi:MAG: YicC family protein [Verrucomicrobia bacterium]|nr:YicC family protein [Verrucomicrobiota bacterium]
MHSMTGYGRGQSTCAGVKLAVEIQSVNKRQIDLAINLPATLAVFEADVRAAVARRVHRGRLTVTVVIESGAAGPIVKINESLAHAYLKAFRGLQVSLGLNSEVSLDTLVRLPGVIETSHETGTNPSVKTALSGAIESALDQLMAMRAKEGAHLQRDLLKRTRLMHSILAKVKRLRPQAIARYRSNLQDRLQKLELDVSTDDERLAKEVAFFAERSDFSEEVTRLESHLDQFEATCRQPDSIGRTLEFIAQEIGRELNTLSAKANDVEISQLVVQAKAELDKIREQIQNVE